MMQTETDVKPSSTDGTSDEELDHLYCECSEDIALCGTDLSEAEELSFLLNGAVDCIVCMDLVEFPCSRCGEC